MKVIFLVKNLPPLPDGVGDYTYNLLDSMAAGNPGSHFFIITSAGADKNIFENSPNITVLPVVEQWNSSASAKILAEIKKIRPDHINLQYVPYAYNPLGIPFWVVLLWLRLKLAGYKLSVMFHEVAVIFDKRFKYWPIGISQRLIAYSLHLLNNGAMTSMRSYRAMFPFGKKKMRLQPVGANIRVNNRETLQDQSLALKQKLSENGKYFLLVTFGTDGPERKTDLLLEAVQQLPQVKIVQVGKGDRILKTAQKLGMEDRVYVSGYLSVPDVYTYLRAADLFCLLQADIRGGVGFKSGALAAAFYCGLPILAGQGPITDPSLLKHRENIYLLNNLAPDVLRAAILELMNNNSLIAKMSEGSAAFYRQHLSWEVHTNSYMELTGIKTPNNIVQ